MYLLISIGCIQLNKINCLYFFYRNIFFDENGEYMKTAGEIYKLPKLAETLKIIAKEGVKAVYNGSLTSKIIQDLKKVNGIITKKDLADYK